MRLFPIQSQSKPAAFAEKVRSCGSAPITSLGIETLQVNVGYRCNQSCAHCHIVAGPGRSESMSEGTADLVLRALADNPIETLDITGGEPELNPNFRHLVIEAKKEGRRVIVRTNLSVLFEPGMEDLPEFYRKQGVELIASLPCYLEENVDRMRGGGVFGKSLSALRRLNNLGYGTEGGRPLHLVYNPAGPFLPPPQAALEQDYKRELGLRHGVVFTGLYTFTNMPIGRFRERLARDGALDEYAGALACAFNPRTLDRLMCRRLVSVGWDGGLSDCDFNQVLGIPVKAPAPSHIARFDHAALSSREIAVGDHCYACTAGQGST